MHTHTHVQIQIIPLQGHDLANRKAFLHGPTAFNPGAGNWKHFARESSLRHTAQTSSVGCASLLGADGPHSSSPIVAPAYNPPPPKKIKESLISRSPELLLALLCVGCVMAGGNIRLSSIKGLMVSIRWYLKRPSQNVVGGCWLLQDQDVPFG